MSDFYDDEVSGMDVMGFDVTGGGFDVVGPAPRGGIVRPTRYGGQARVVRPAWRNGQLAPGVQIPQEGLMPITLQAPNGNTFNLANQNLTFVARTQKPFRGERLLVSVVRTGASAVGRLIGQMFMGTDLQQADINGFDIETVGNPNAFGVRLAMSPIEPGVDISMVVRLSSALAGTDTIQATIQILGRAVH